MPWTFSRSESYLEQKRQLPLWRRRVMNEKKQLAEEGKLISYPLPGMDNLLIAKVDDESESIEFQRIQIQTKNQLRLHKIRTVEAYPPSS